MKNFKLFLIACLGVSVATLFGETISDGLMNCLANSTTLVRGSKKWLKTMEKDGAAVKTAAAIRNVPKIIRPFNSRPVLVEDVKHSGLLALLYAKAHEKSPVTENASSGLFSLKHDAGNVEVHSKMTMTRRESIDNEDEEASFMQQCRDDNGKSFEESDDYTHCTIQQEFAFSDEANRLGVSKGVFTCRSSFPYDVYQEKLNKATAYWMTIEQPT